LTTADILSYYFFDGRATAQGSAVPADAWRLEPVTVVQPGYAGINGKLMSTLSANPNPLRNLTGINGTTDLNSKTGKVVQVSFYLFSQGETAREIVLQDLNITTSMTGVASEVVDAVRLSVWRAGYQQDAITFVPETEETAHVFGFTKDYAYTFTSANPAYYHSTPVYTVSGVDPDFVYTLAGFNKISDLTRGYNGTGNPLEYVDPTTTWNSVYYNTLAAQDGGVSPKASADTILTLAKNVPTLVTVRIFVEGWAANTTNNIIASAFSISYKFSIKAIV
jgi:hypothetical protein